MSTKIRPFKAKSVKFGDLRLWRIGTLISVWQWYLKIEVSVLDLEFLVRVEWVYSEMVLTKWLFLFGFKIILVFDLETSVKGLKVRILDSWKEGKKNVLLNLNTWLAMAVNWPTNMDTNSKIYYIILKKIIVDKWASFEKQKKVGNELEIMFIEILS